MLLRVSSAALRGLAGALDARTATLVHVIGERKDSDLFIALVEAVRRRYSHSSVIHLVLDNCIIHKSHKTLHHLPRLGTRV